MKKRKIIVFDMDDVLWNLNKKASRMAGVPIEKITDFHTMTNPNLTDAEKLAMSDAYTSLELFENIEFYDVMIRLINGLYEDYPQYDVRIVSNCSSEIVRKYKYDQLCRVCALPESQIELHVIDMRFGGLTKRLPSGMFIFVDDSPYNIALSDAKHRIMPPAYHNNVVMNGLVHGVPAVRPDTIEDTADLVMEYIAKDLKTI